MDELNQNRCHIFDLTDDEEAGKETEHLKFVKKYGDTCNGHWLYTFDDGYRYLAKCEKCGKLVLVQFSEYEDADDRYYYDFFPVASEEEAEELNRKWDGSAIERKFDGRYLMQTGKTYRFAEADRRDVMRKCIEEALQNGEITEEKADLLRKLY